MTTAAELRKLVRQQAAVAGLGSFALRQSDLLKVLTEAATVDRMPPLTCNGRRSRTPRPRTDWERAICRANRRQRADDDN